MKKVVEGILTFFGCIFIVVAVSFFMLIYETTNTEID